MVQGDICLAYPTHEYPPGAKVSPDQVRDIQEEFKQLRFADETIYLRSRHHLRVCHARPADPAGAGPRDPRLGPWPSLSGTCRDRLAVTQASITHLRTAELYLVVFDRTPGKAWEEKLFHRVKTVRGKDIGVWGM